MKVKSSRFVSAIIAALFAAPVVANASLGGNESAALDQAFSVFQMSRSFAELFANPKVHLSGDEIRFLNEKIHESGAQAMPKVSRRGIDQFVFEVGHDLLIIKVLSVNKLRVTMNGKSLDLSGVGNIQEYWKIIESSLPDANKKNALLEFIFPQAHAMWIQAAKAVLLVGSAVFYAILNRDEKCQELKQSMEECANKLRDIEDWYTEVEQGREEGIRSDAQKALQENEKAEEEMAKAMDKQTCLSAAKDKDAKGACETKVAVKSPKKKSDEKSGDDDDDDKQKTLKNWLTFIRRKNEIGKCPKVGPNKDLDRDTGEMFSSVVPKMNTWRTQLAQCATQVKNLDLRNPFKIEIKINPDPVRTCVDHVVQVSKELCFHQALKVIKRLDTNRITPSVQIATPTDASSTSK